MCPFIPVFNNNEIQVFQVAPGSASYKNRGNWWRVLPKNWRYFPLYQKVRIKNHLKRNYAKTGQKLANSILLNSIQDQTLPRKTPRDWKPTGLGGTSPVSLWQTCHTQLSHRNYQNSKENWKCQHIQLPTTHNSSRTDWQQHAKRRCNQSKTHWK